MAVYIPPRAVPAAAGDVIHETPVRMQTQHPDAFIVISGDFNHVSLSSHLAGFVQYVDCPTQENETLDLLYANAKGASTATPLPPPSRSDHNLVLVNPSYKPCVTRQPVTTRMFRKWTPEACENLRACYEWTERCFPNNRPWNTSDIKRLLNQKKAASRECDREKRRLVQHKLRWSLSYPPPPTRLPAPPHGRS